MDPTVNLTACLRGDKRAWDAFVERYARVIHAAVARTCRAHDARLGEQDVEDIAQDVFVRLVKDDFRLLRSYDPAKASLATWLTIVSRSMALDALRRRRPTAAPLEAAAEVAQPPQPPPPPADSPATGAVEVPEGLLSGRQRLVLHLLFDEELSVEAAAEAMGVEAQTVRSTKHKALLKLREHFGAGP